MNLMGEKLNKLFPELKNPAENENAAMEAEMDVLPYDFISIDDPIESTHCAKKQQDLKTNYTGVMTVDLQLKSPMVAIDEMGDVVEIARKSGGQKNSVPIYDYRNALGKGFHKKIPASSIRGMLHNAAEIIWNDVLTVEESNGSNRKLREYIPADWLSEKNTLENHGLASHFFGFVQNQSNENSKKKNKGIALSSLLQFSDAVTEHAEYQEAYLKPFTLASPNGLLIKGTNRFNMNYMEKTKKRLRPAGRKVYLAGRTKDLEKRCIAETVKEAFRGFVGEHWKINREKHICIENGKAVQLEKIILIAPNTVYTFNIYFKNLKEEELAALVRLIELNAGAEASELAKKATYAIGRGKPLGFGRVRLTVRDIYVRDATKILDLNAPEFSRQIDKAELYKGSNPYQKKYEEYFALTDDQTFDGHKIYQNKGKKVKRYTKLKRGTKL
ncbi:hypothetical protein NST62_02140 [Ureibacillus sp. FSL K6-8385]|uniref:hypothetical protein n=1 Tax=Ureibacillus TaxID=160795 RepID=UPI002E204ED4|nr:RAMP superfamily CRISPR-associated protein [Ureibacillus terrenus]MED3764938.1 RAMP superfamily CRISPR-associated protein [Ureibacillus terrenus]